MNNIMNNISKILLGLAAISALASCDRKADYQRYSFARIDASSYIVNENGGTLTVPVTAYNADGKSGSVTFTVTPSSAKEGVNYTFEPANGVLNFSGNGSQNITFNIVNQEGVFTGDLNFRIDLTGTSGDLELGANPTRSARVTIKDLDHPLAAILGTWVAQDLMGYWGDDYSGHEIVIAADPKDITKVLLTKLDPYLGAAAGNEISGQVNDDKTKITIAQGQNTGYQDTFFLGFNTGNPETATDYDNIYFEVVDAKTLKLVNAYGSRNASGWYEILLGGATFKKK
jgi:hypothetical protein